MMLEKMSQESVIVLINKLIKFFDILAWNIILINH